VFGFAGNPPQTRVRLNGVMKRIIALLIAASIAISACGTDATSDTTGTTGTPGTTVSDETLAPRAAGTDAKLESNLYQAILLAADGTSIEDIVARQQALQFDGDMVLIEVTFDEMTPDAVAAAEATGMTVTGEYPDLLMITGSAPISALRELAALDSVDSVVPAFGATTNR